MRRPVLNFFQTASLVMGLVAIALLSAITTMHFAIHGAEVVVPSLKQMTVAEARSQTAGMGLTLEVDNRYYSGEVPAGHILTQSPTPGTVVRREWQVRVAESLGPQKVEVPDTVGLDERIAALQLRRVGLGVGAIARMPYAGVAENTVLAQDPPAKARGIDRPNINLLVAAPPDRSGNEIVMPALVGMPLASAQDLLEKAGLRANPPIFVSVPIGTVGSGNAAPLPPLSPGVVTAQKPLGGTHVDPSTSVDLTVSR